MHLQAPKTLGLRGGAEESAAAKAQCCAVCTGHAALCCGHCAVASAANSAQWRERHVVAVGESFSHAALSYFSLDKLTPKGPRKNADVGNPADSTRSLANVGKVSVGSWSCTDGGWDSPAMRATTEVFYVFTGEGCVTDTDGTKHEFGPGDTVILPKGETRFFFTSLYYTHRCR